MHEPDHNHNLSQPADNIASHRPMDDCEACPAARKAGAKFCFSCGRCLAPPEAAEARPYLETSQTPADQRSDDVSAEQGPATPAGATIPGETAQPEVRPVTESPQQAWPTPVTQPPPTVQAAEATSPPTVMPTCHCGQVLPAEADYCFRCGAKVGDRQPEYQLVAVSSNGSPRRPHPIQEEVTLGKTDGCDVVLADDEFISRRHARIGRDDGMLFLEDLGSSNGTFLRLRRPIPLEIGDEFLVGKTVLRLERRQ